LFNFKKKSCIVIIVIKLKFSNYKLAPLKTDREKLENSNKAEVTRKHI